MPVLSVCFRKTIAVWVPAAVLWLAAPLQVYHLSRRIGPLAHSIPLNRYNVARMVAVLLVIATNVVQLCLDLKHFIGGVSSVADVTAPMLNVFTFVSDYTIGYIQCL